MYGSEPTPESDHVEIADESDHAFPPTPASLTREMVRDGAPPMFSTAPTRRPYSTTSSVYAEHTLSNPDNDQVIYCIGAVLQAQIFDACVDMELYSGSIPEFDVEVHLPAELGGPASSVPEQVLSHEALNDFELRQKLIAGAVPTVDTMYKFMRMMIRKASYSAECNILALVYVTRITSQHKVALTMKNWRGLWIASILLAQKVWDDIPLRTASFAAILPNITKEDLRKMEMKAFQLLDHNTTVKPSVYAMYYFELRELFHDLSGKDSRFLWELAPLSVVQAHRLDERSSIKGSVVATTSSKRLSGSIKGSSRAPSATSTHSSRNRAASPVALTTDEITVGRARFVLS